jgi:hypothetical protein
MKSQTTRHGGTSDGKVAHGVITANKVYSIVRVYNNNIIIRSNYRQHMLPMVVHANATSPTPFAAKLLDTATFELPKICFNML